VQPGVRKGSMADRVTLKDVARAAGIATATASHALNRNGTVSLETAARVQQVADQLGYRRDMTAVNLRRQRTFTVGLLIPRVSDPYFGELAEAMELMARTRGYTVLGGTTQRDPQLEQHYLDVFLGRRCDGVIVIMGRQTPAAMLRARIPTVLVNCHATEHSLGTALVEVDDSAGMESAVAHLIGLGHRRIALATIPGVDLRRQGYRRALAAADIPFDPELILDAGDYLGLAVADSVRSTVYGRITQLLRDHADVTAIAATTDMLGLYVLRAAHLAGRRVPDDLALVAFDGIGIGATVVPALTTVAQPIEAIATSAMDLIVEQLEEGGVATEQRQIMLETRLVIRESCGSSRSSPSAQP
jgi:DNA-binding LacI/PurR family transcriptional regulator